MDKCNDNKKTGTDKGIRKYKAPQCTPGCLAIYKVIRDGFNPRLSAEVAFVRPEKEQQSNWLVWPNNSFYWPRVFIFCKQMQRAFNVFKNTLKWLKIDSVDQKFNWLEWGNFSQDAGMPGTERVIAFSQLAVKGLISSTLLSEQLNKYCWTTNWSHNVQVLWLIVLYLCPGRSPDITGH
jgi:hypothetical protein